MMCVHTHTCRFVHMCVHVHMEVKVNLGVISQASPPLLYTWISPWPKIHQLV